VCGPVLSFSLETRVYYEDTDMGGVVYYANYLKFMERARTELLRSAGIDQRLLLQNEGLQFVVRRANVEYLAPARMDDLLTVTADVTKMRKASLVFQQQCKRVDNRDEPAQSTLLVSAEVLIACVDAANGKPCAFPASLTSVLNH